MCGIAGFLDPTGGRPADELAETATRMASTLRHRGPDDEGVWVDPEHGIALGHRRLSVLDLSRAGHQPMLSPCGRWVLVYNGEIYNHAELRRELEARGHRFVGHSDTEVVATAVSEWSPVDAVSRMNGMFAFALWDRAHHRLVLGRDRFGEKPLFYGEFSGVVLFASELKAMRAGPAFDDSIDRAALADFVRHGFVPGPRTIFENVRKVAPGSLVTIGRGATATTQRYWDVATAVAAARRDPFAGSDDEATDELESRLDDAVRIRLDADVPLGAFLSGGIDSSTVAAFAHRHSSDPLRTFAVGFGDAAYDEAAAAAAVARHLGTDHVELRVGADDALALIPSLPHVYDEPFADPSQLPTMLLASAARRHVTVALSGDGGDEVFVGYNRHVHGPSLWRRTRHLPAPARHAVAAALRRVPPARWDAAARRLGVRIPNAGDKARTFARVLEADSAGALLDALTSNWADPASVVVSDGNGAAADRHASADASDPLDALVLHDLAVTLPDDMLTKVDRASMAVGLEMRVPLLDHHLAEFCWRLPPGLHIRRGRGKWLLRQVLHRHVPRELVDRPKTGFDPPLAAWLRGPLRSWGEDLLTERRLRRDGWFDPSPVRARWREHLEGSHNWDYALWTVLMFQAWLDA